MALTKKQTKFVDEYIKDFNATQAGIRAGYSVKTAYSAAGRLLKKVEIQKSIEQKQKLRSKRTDVTQDRVLIEIARLAFNDPRKAFDENNVLLSVADWPDELAAAISKIRIKAIIDKEGKKIGETEEVYFWDKTKSLDLAAKHLGMLGVDKQDADEDKAQPLNININVNKSDHDDDVTVTTFDG